MTVASIIQKKVLYKEHSSEYLTVFFLLMLFGILPFSSKITFAQPVFTLFLFYVFSLLAVFSLLLLIKSYKHSQLSSVEPLRNLSPLVVFLIAYFVLGETVNWINGLGIGLLIVGGYILEATIHHSNIFHPFKLLSGKYTHYTLISIFLGGFGTVLARKLVLMTDPYTTMFFLFFFSSFNMVIIQFTFYKGMDDIIYVMKTNGWLVLIVAVTAFLSDLAYLSALAMPSAFAALAISIRRLSTLFTTIIGGEIFHETRLLVKSIACMVMLSGVYLIIL